MVLQEEFKANGYINLLDVENAKEYSIDVGDIFDYEKKPKELLGLYISKHLDELFFLLNGDGCDINSLCDTWDRHIQTFTIINGKSESIQKLKYNIVQLVICSNEKLDRSRETNLMITRKIILRGNLDNPERIIVADSEEIELPFHMISSDAFTADKEKVKQLEKMMPTDTSVVDVLRKEIKKEQHRLDKDKMYKKSFDKQDFKVIREWLES